MIINRIITLAALAAASGASTALAGFTITASSGVPVTVNGTPMTRYDITAINTGGDTGTQVKGLEYFYTGPRIYFQVNDETDPLGGEPDHIPDTANLNSNTLTRIRLSTTTANNVYVGQVPIMGQTQFNPYMVGLKSFSGAVANTGTTQATGAGFQIMRLFSLRNAYSFNLSGNIGGDVGTKVPFSTYLGPIPGFPGPTPPVIQSISPEPVVATFGADVSVGAPFSVTVHAAASDPASILALSVTPIPGIRDVVVTGGGAGPQDFVITGKVDYSRLYNPTIVPINVSGSVDSFCVFAVPEPAGVAALVLGVPFARRRRADACGYRK